MKLNNVWNNNRLLIDTIIEFNKLKKRELTRAKNGYHFGDIYQPSLLLTLRGKKEVV